MRYIPTNPVNSRYLLYFTGTQASTGNKCIGVATASGPAGPFTGQDQPLICPSGGAQDPSPLLMPDGSPIQELVYSRTGANAGIYNQVLTADGLSIQPGLTTPYLLYTPEPSWWHNGVVDRPNITLDNGTIYLFFSGGTPGTANRGIGWSTCTQGMGVVLSCKNQTMLGKFIASTSNVFGPAAPQVFSDGSNNWLLYDGAASPTGGRSMRMDKLCFAHAMPRSNAPTTTPQSVSRSTNCSTDVPGAAPTIPSVTNDGTTVTWPTPVRWRDGTHVAAVGGRALWTYHDTDQISPCPFISNTAALGVPAAAGTAPNWQTEPLSGPNNCTSLFIPYSAEENAYNAQHNCGPPCDGKRIALWPMGLAPSRQNGDAYSFFLKLIHDTDNDGTGPDPGCGLCYDSLGIGVVRVAAGTTTADARAVGAPGSCNPTCLFDEADEAAIAGQLTQTMVDDSFVYAFSNAGAFGDSSRLARVPIVDVTNKSAWRFWHNDGSATGTWSSAITDASIIPERWGGSTEYNPYLDQYVNITEHFFYRGEGKYWVQTAPNPWGPWTHINSAQPTFIGPPCPGKTTYASNQHGLFSMDGGRTIDLTYIREPGSGCPGQQRWVKVKFQ